MNCPFDAITAADLKDSADKWYPVGKMGKPYYVFSVQVPEEHISSHIQESEGLSILNIATDELRRVMLTVQRVRLLQRVDRQAILELTVAEPYLPVVHRELCRVDEAVFLRKTEESVADNASTEERVEDNEGASIA